MSTQRVDRKEFRRVRPEGDAKEKVATPENEIRVTAQRGQRSYISYAIALFNGGEGKAKQDTIKISGMGAAIFNAVNIAEIVKRRVKGLHQITTIASETVKDSYEGVNEKTKTLDVERKVSTILVTLSTKQLDSKNIGYQQPIPEDQVTEQEDRPPAARRGGRGSGRGSGRGASRGGRGSGRGASRGGRGSGRDATRGGRGSGRDATRGDAPRGGRVAADKPKDDAKKPTEKKTDAPAGRGSARGATRGSGRGAARGGNQIDHQKAGEEFEDKLDRQKGDGHKKQAPKSEAKPKSVRNN